MSISTFDVNSKLRVKPIIALGFAAVNVLLEAGYGLMEHVGQRKRNA
jgi:hypothetical protein